MDRAARGDISAVIEAAKAVAQAGQDPVASPFVEELTTLYEHSPGREAEQQALVDRAAAGDPSAVLELERGLQLAGAGTTPEAEAV